VGYEALRRKWLRFLKNPTQRHGNLLGTAEQEAALLAFAFCKTKVGQLPHKPDIILAASIVFGRAEGDLVSKGWYARFLKQYQKLIFKNKRASTSAGRINDPTILQNIEAFIAKFEELMKMFSFKPSNIINCDETLLRASDGKLYF